MFKKVLKTEKLFKLDILYINMKIHFDIKKDEIFPYRARYEGYFPQVNPKIGMGELIGIHRNSYSSLLESVLADLHGCPENIELDFSEKIPEETQKITQLAFDLLNQYNVIARKRRKALEDLT